MSKIEPCPLCKCEMDQSHFAEDKVVHPYSRECALTHGVFEKGKWNRRADAKAPHDHTTPWEPVIDDLREAGRKRMEFVNSHKNELVEAFGAKTGLQPDECTLCIQADIASDAIGLTRYWVERKGEREKPARLLEAAKELLAQLSDNLPHLAPERDALARAVEDFEK